MTDLAALAELALDVAREAGELIRSSREAGVEIADTKSSATDIVTAADRASEALIKERVLAARPGDGFLGEEGADLVGTSGIRWVVDPIDGTVNYSHGLSSYAVSIGVEVDGEVAVGVVVCPARSLEYTAVLGQGARRNGVPIQVAAPVPMGKALVGTGFSYVEELRVSQTRTFAALLPQNIAVQIYRALLESAAGEQAARMTAMDNAIRNAGDMINRLTINYNRSRQAFITKELIEIISGAEAV